jgi:hypothetical protein
MKKRKPVPFEFVLEQLASLNPQVKPMFGCHAIYVGEKIVLMLRKKDTGVEDNGVWVALTAAHQESLKRQFPVMRPVQLLPTSASWQIIPLDADDFEACMLEVCQLVLKNDIRIGKVPKPKKRKH